MSERYEIRGKLGKGGMSQVYLAFDSVMGREVAIKRLLPLEETNLNEDAGNVLASEAAALAQFQHPNIVTVYAFEQDKDGPYVVMELVEGADLHQVLKDGALSIEDFKDIAIQCLEPLISASELSLLHRDIKPGNIMLTMTASERFLVKILDFGLAKFSQQPSTQTLDQAGSFLGSIDYIAPEQLELLPLDQRTDLYSLGCVLYYALAQKAPFSGDNPAETTMNHLNHRVVSIHELRPDVPQALADWLMSMIARNPDERPSNALDALHRFRAAEGGDPVASIAAPITGTVEPQSPVTGPVTGDVSPPGDAVHAEPVTGSVSRPVIHTSPQLPRPRANSTRSTGVRKAEAGSDKSEVFKQPLVLGGIGLALLGIFLLFLPGKKEEAEQVEVALEETEAPAPLIEEAEPSEQRPKFVLPETIGLPEPAVKLAELPTNPPFLQRFATLEGMLGREFQPAAPSGGRVASWINLKNRKKFRSLYPLFNDEFAEFIPTSKILTEQHLPVLKGQTRAATFTRSNCLVTRTGPLPLERGFTLFFVGRMEGGAGRQIHVEPNEGGGPVAGIKVDYSNNVVGSTRIGAGLTESTVKVPWGRPKAGVIAFGSSPADGKQRLLSFPAATFKAETARGDYESMKSPFQRVFLGENNQEATQDGATVTWVFEFLMYDQLLSLEKMEDISRRLAGFYFKEP